MDWKQKLKWKVLIILLALFGIVVVWQANRAGERRQTENSRSNMEEMMIRENELASAGFPEEPESLPLEKEVSAKSEPARETAAEADDVISVLLMTDDYAGYYHEEVKFSFQGSYHLSGSREEDIEAQETLTLTGNSDCFKDGKVEITPENKENRAVLLSVNRQQGNPVYRGSFTVYQEEEGLRVVNTLLLEEYLYGVVPSEMPSSYESEALKAQAVCARTYACVQMEKSSLESLGAQVDDSVSYQVYQNGGEADAASAAVDATKGEVLTSGGELITAYYFSTSSGRTSTDEVWKVSAPAAYLKSVECGYDADEPWHKWNVTFSAEKLLENVQKMFPEVSVLNAVRTEQTGEGGAVLKLCMETDQGEKEAAGEYAVREILSPDGLTVTRQDGSVVKGGTLLPSAYFSLKEQRDEENNLTGCILEGGGYGHGVGMSQNGANGMAAEGMNYKEILNYFYQDVELTKATCYN